MYSNRRGFLKQVAATTLLIGTGAKLAGCDFGGRFIEEQASDPLTVLDMLTKAGHSVAVEYRELDGQQESYVIAMDRIMEGDDQYWLFFVDDQPIDGPVDEVMVKPGQWISAQLIEPLQLSA